jgi:hypothetical protein
LQACEYDPPPAPEYGPGPGWRDDVAIHGVVLSEKTKAPVSGIRVSVNSLSSYAYTDDKGNFYVYVPRQDSYQLKIEDADGAENGAFKEQNKKISLEDALSPLSIHLDAE